MGRRVQRLPVSVPDDGTEVGSPQLDDITIETTFDGQTYAWGPGQVRNFADDGVGVGHQNADQVPQGGTGTAGLASVFAGSNLFSTNSDENH
jgi:hypothetical protein